MRAIIKDRYGSVRVLDIEIRIKRSLIDKLLNRAGTSYLVFNYLIGDIKFESRVYNRNLNKKLYTHIADIINSMGYRLIKIERDENDNNM